VVEVSAIITWWLASTICFKTAHRPLNVQLETGESIKIIMESATQTLMRK